MKARKNMTAEMRRVRFRPRWDRGRLEKSPPIKAPKGARLAVRTGGNVIRTSVVVAKVVAMVDKEKEQISKKKLKNIISGFI